jgi:hypothetical protein
LERFGESILVDGTFRTIELGLTLTTILIEVNGISVPVVWFFSGINSVDFYLFVFFFLFILFLLILELQKDKQTTANYLWFLKSA